MNKKKIQI